MHVMAEVRVGQRVSLASVVVLTTICVAIATVAWFYMPGVSPDARVVEIVFMAEPARRWQAHEAVGEALYPSAFLVDRNQQRRTAQPTNFPHQFTELILVAVIPREQDHTADEGRRQTFAFLRVEALRVVC